MPSGIDLLTENDRNVTLPSFFYGCLFVMNIDIDIRISFTVTLVYASTLLYQSSGYRRNITKPQSPSIPEWYVIYLELVRVTLLNNWWMRTPIYPYNEVGEPTRLRYNLDLANVNENNLKRAIVVFVAIANFAPNQMNKITWRTWILLFSVRKASYTIALWWEIKSGN